MSEATSAATTPTADEVRRAVDSVPLWYHTIDLPHGISTPGWFDLRPILDKMLWPDLTGKRCLDVGTWDGFLAFEMERRGASEVVAIDIPDHTQWDVPARGRAHVAKTLDVMVGEEKGNGFQTAHKLLNSKVKRTISSVYDLTPDKVGEFDFAICGSLLLHLRDPVRALEAIRSVTRGEFLSTDFLRLRTTMLHPRRPVAQLDGDPALVQWWHPNLKGLRHMIYTAGFEIQKQSRPYAIPLGVGHPPVELLKDKVLGVGRRALLGRDGLPHVAILCRPGRLD
ncbi:class I SAM-dependent methyltransferase [Patulibacter defluvii]|uniref:class I SAM-dependent methyltransferase n=1 Tax=Patulibacter defluvii TaxID=3095358 RepID=UPI002A756FC7|nr:methyltransferase domain-containing protein [Patulibacter sp. DM4]